MGKCTVQESWFQQKDPNGYLVKEWAAKESSERIFCKVCKSSFSITKGFDRVRQHATADSHKKACRAALDPSQLHLEKARPAEVPDSTGTSSSTSASADVTCVDSRDAGMKAALIWAMKVARCNYSFSSCDDIQQIFRAMFPAENAVPSDFSLGKTKVAYLLTEALGPYFFSALLEDIGQAFVSILYDETTNAESKKELVVAVRYCSLSTKLIETRHLKTFFMGKARAKDLEGNISAALDDAGIPLSRLLMLGADGPNVNKAVETLMNQKVLEVRPTPLIDLGSCPIHTVMNSFLKGLKELGDEVSDAIIEVHEYLNGWPVRQEEFREIQEKTGVPKHRFIKHVKSRWLTLEPAASRFLEQLPASKEYFMRHLPKNNPKLSKRPGCKKIVDHLKRPTLKAELLFVIASAKLFARFTRTFQADEPLVHVLYSELESLFTTLALRVCKKSAVDNKELYLSEHLFDTPNLLPVEDIVWDDELASEIRSLHPRDRLEFCNQARQHYIRAAKYLLEKSPLKKKPIVKSLRCLHPDARRAEESRTDILLLAKELPVDVRADILSDEWLLMTTEPGIERKARVDEYWSQFYDKRYPSGDLKYPSLSKVVQAALALSHGNAFVERWFSGSSDTVTDDRTLMSENTLNALNNVKSGLKMYQDKVHLVPITKSLLALGRSAYSKYALRLEAQKKEESKKREQETEQQKQTKKDEEARKNAERNKRLLAEEESKLEKMRKDLKEQEETSNALFMEASNRLRSATQAKDLKGVSIAQAMLEGVNVSRRETEKLAEATKKQQDVVDKRKAKIISFVDCKRRKT